MYADNKTREVEETYRNRTPKELFIKVNCEGRIRKALRTKRDYDKTSRQLRDQTQYCNEKWWEVSAGAKSTERKMLSRPDRTANIKSDPEDEAEELKDKDNGVKRSLEGFDHDTERTLQGL